MTETRPFALRSDVRHEAAAAQLAARLEQLEAAARDAAIFKVCSQEGCSNLGIGAFAFGIGAQAPLIL